LLVPHLSQPPPSPPDLELHHCRFPNNNRCHQLPPIGNLQQQPPSPWNLNASSLFQSPPPHTPPLPQQQPLPPTPSHRKLAAAQQHLQWINAVLSFCFSYPIIMLQFQYTQTDQNQSNVSLIVLSFLVLITFNLFLLVLFIKPISTRTSETLEKVGVLVAATAFCHTIAIPFPLELKYIVKITF
ncbi:hypothetical protein ERO13_D09G091420v2, partial [Gossypium hirsutum]